MIVPPLPKIRISKGSVSRLARPPRVTKGEWYVIVRCKSCKKPIYLLHDSFRGADSHRFVGDGFISTPCQRCFSDELYATYELTSFQADEDLDWGRLPRIEPSNMPRQPLSKKYPNVKPTFGPGFLEDRPQAAALVARCIALWTEVETEEARLLATMLRANVEPAIALFLTLQSSRIQFAALEAVARVVLDPDDYDLFSALMKYRDSVEKERNSLAHGCFGGSPAIPDAVIWIDPADLTQHTVRVTATGVTDEAMDWLRSRTFVYELGDLETIARDIENLHKQLSFFIGYLVSRHLDPPMPDAWRAQRYSDLSAEPRVAQALASIRANKKGGTASSQSG